jgi:hypothetical protein
MADQICRTKSVNSFYCRTCTPRYTLSQGLVCLPCGEEICCFTCVDKLQTLKTGDGVEFILCPQCFRAHHKKPSVYDYPVLSKLLAFRKEDKSANHSSGRESAAALSKQQLHLLMRSMTRDFEREISECCERVKSEVALAVDEKVSRLYKARNDVAKVISNYQSEARSFMHAYTRLNDLSEENFAECLRAMCNEQCENIEFIREIVSKLNSEETTAAAAAAASRDFGNVASELLGQLSDRLRSKADVDLRREVGTNAHHHQHHHHQTSNQKIHIKIKMVLDYDLSKLSLNDTSEILSTTSDVSQMKN